MPILAPFILQFKESKSKSRRKLDNKIRSISNKNEVDKQLTLEMEELDDMSDYDDDDLADENETEGKEKNFNGNLFELSEPIRNFVNFWTAPIVKFFYFQVTFRIKF
jgi:hypothetical protein